VGEVIANMSMSLDGFVEDATGSALPLFGWMENLAQPSGDAGHASADLFQEATARVGALVCGRRLFDLTKGWGGRHPTGAHVFVVTHHPPADWPHRESFTFVPDGVASVIAQARQVAGERTVAVATPDITRQCLDLGLLDEIAVDLVPVLLGAGKPFFAGLEHAPVRLGTPTVVQGADVTHLHFRVEQVSR
jgi:dihydrofolate reductase